jgi:hypothetical protein
MKNWVPFDLKKNLAPLITIGSISAKADDAKSVAATRLDNIFKPRIIDYG